jgi:UDP-glucose 4-epimerase
MVTGGAGFIGSHVAEMLVRQSSDVLVVDNLLSGSRENVPSRARFVELDIVDSAALLKAAVEFEVNCICHLAAQSSVTVSVHSPELDLDINVRGTYNVCEIGRVLEAPVVFASTGGALYGDAAPIPTPEQTLTEPLSPYGASKQAGEAYVGTWGRLHGHANVVLRLGNVYGPRQNPHGEAGVVAIFSDRLLSGQAPTVYGDGRPTRDYVHVTDVARAFIVAMRGGERGTFNVGSGIGTNVLTLLDHLQTAAGTDVAPVFEPLREGELQRSTLDPGRMASQFGWAAEIPIEQGLRETFDWYSRATRSGVRPER